MVSPWSAAVLQSCSGHSGAQQFVGLVTRCHFTDQGNAGRPQGREAKHGEGGERVEKDAQGAIKSVLDTRREDRKTQNAHKEDKYPEVKESNVKHEQHEVFEGLGENTIPANILQIENNEWPHLMRE